MQSKKSLISHDATGVSFSFFSPKVLHFPSFLYFISFPFPFHFSSTPSSFFFPYLTSSFPQDAKKMCVRRITRTDSFDLMGNANKGGLYDKVHFFFPKLLFNTPPPFLPFFPILPLIFLFYLFIFFSSKSFSQAMGPIGFDDTCDTCRQPYRFCPGHFGYIELPFPIYHPLLFTSMYNILKVGTMKKQNETKKKHLAKIISFLSSNVFPFH